MLLAALEISDLSYQLFPYKYFNIRILVKAVMWDVMDIGYTHFSVNFLWAQKYSNCMKLLVNEVLNN